jgi:hypothetical protein
MTDYRSWKVGDEIECVFDNNVTEWLQIGGRYKISEIIGHDLWNYNGCNVSVKLVGFSFPVALSNGTFATSFGAYRFRKPVETKHDISIFKAMLNKSIEQNHKELRELEELENV